MALLISFFLQYLLAPVMVLVGIVVANIMGKTNKALSMKRLIAFILVLALILTVPSLFGLLRYEFVWGGLVLTIFTYLALGFILNRVINSGFLKPVGIHESAGMVILSISISVILAAWLYYHAFGYLNGLNYAEWSMLSVAWFFVPVSNRYARLAFLNIPSPIYKAFLLSDQEIDEAYWNNLDAFRLKQVNVRIKRKKTSKSDTAFSVRLPGDTSVGHWFKRFIEDQNIRFPDHQIETADSGGNEYSWTCYTPRWFFVPIFIRVVDFNKNVKANRIKNKGLIYLRRVTNNA